MSAHSKMLVNCPPPFSPIFQWFYIKLKSPICVQLSFHQDRKISCLLFSPLNSVRENLDGNQFQPSLSHSFILYNPKNWGEEGGGENTPTNKTVRHSVTSP